MSIYTAKSRCFILLKYDIYIYGCFNRYFAVRQLRNLQPSFGAKSNIVQNTDSPFCLAKVAASTGGTKAINRLSFLYLAAKHLNLYWW